MEHRRQTTCIFLLIVVSLLGVAIAVGVILVRKDNSPNPIQNTTPWPTPVPTPWPTIQPTPVPIIIGPSTAIQTTQELYEMVDLWLNGSFTSDSTWAAMYGYPIGQWDVSLITDFSFLFAAACDGCNPSNRNPLAVNFKNDISTWNVSSAKNMSGMFESATSFDSDVSQWNVANVVDMSYMFAGASSFDSDLSQWNVANVVDMNHMFIGARSFNSDLSQWNVANVVDMSGMFNQADAFNGDISQWNVANVLDMSRMFLYADRFNGDISHWNVANVLDMSFMFYAAGSFDQNLCDWADVLPSNADTTFAFLYASSCPNNEASPVLSANPANPKGPFCYNCV